MTQENYLTSLPISRVGRFPCMNLRQDDQWQINWIETYIFVSASLIVSRLIAIRQPTTSYCYQVSRYKRRWLSFGVYLFGESVAMKTAKWTWWSPLFGLIIILNNLIYPHFLLFSYRNKIFMFNEWKIARDTIVWGHLRKIILKNEQK